MFRSILEGNNCVLTEAQASNILPRFDFERDETRAIVGALVAAGEVRLDGNTLNLVDGSCGSDDPVADLLGQRDVQQFIAVMAENGCAMTETEGEEIFTARGIGKDQVGAIIGPMIQNGMATFDAGQGLLSVSSAYCSPAPVVVEVQPIEVVPTPTPMDISAQLLAVFNAEGCSIPVANANAAFTEGGLTLQEALSGVGVFIASGQITMGAQGEFIADSSICGAAQGQAVVNTPVTPTPIEPVSPVSEPVSEVTENDGSPEGIFYSIMAQNGCVLAEETARELFPAAGLRMDQVYLITDALIESGEANISGGGAELVVSSARCAQSDTPATPVAPVAVTQTPTVTETPSPTPVAPVVVDASDPRAGLMAMLAANNCEVTQGNAAALIGAAGLEFGPSMQLLSQMMADGTATTPDNGQTLLVGPPLCVASTAEPQTPREVFINLIKQNNCSITAAEFSTLLPVDGLDASAAFAMISDLEAEGVITLPATRDVVTLSAENCR